MTLKITLYGWAVPEDRFRGPGSGTFVDMTYFLDDSISVGEILNAINSSGFNFVRLRGKFGAFIQDRVTVEEFNIGAEPVNEPIQTLTNEEYQQGGYY